MMTAVARRHDMYPNLLHHWRRQAKPALEDGRGLKFLPVAVRPSLRPKPEGSIEIEFDGNIRVRVEADGTSAGARVKPINANDPKQT